MGSIYPTQLCLPQTHPFNTPTHISHWVQHKTKAFNKFTLFGGSIEKEAQDEGGQIADMV